jgi:DNA-binding NtrC family response regulator
VEDIPEFVQYFFQQSKEKHHREDLWLPASLIGYFMRYEWPGNVRQLANCVVRLVVLAQGPEIPRPWWPEQASRAIPTSTRKRQRSTQPSVR